MSCDICLEILILNNIKKKNQFFLMNDKTRMKKYSTI